MVEELLELLQAEVQDRQEQDAESDDEQLMSISKMATTGETTPRTIRLLGDIGGREVLILVDSGSSHSFISEAVATVRQDKVQPMRPVSVKIANGGVLNCSGIIPACHWDTQGHTFSTDVRVLSFGCYDMVVGMDWLEQCGPMLVDWTAKQLQFQKEGQTVILQGLQAKPQQVEPATMEELLFMEQSNSIAHVVAICITDKQGVDEPVPAVIQHILDSFQVVFEEPTGLPEHREWDHAIPLVAGANPVNIRAYRYT